jgi:hypothetical protein
MTAWLWEFGVAAWAMTAAMAPYLLLGFAIAGALSVWLSPAWVERHLGGRGFRPVLTATLLGIPLPLCSCGVLPVAASLRRAKASKGAVAAFLIATPQTGVDSLIITGRMLSPAFAVFRIFAALFSGVLGGMLVALFGGKDEPQDAPPATEKCGCHEGNDEHESPAAAGQTPCCQTTAATPSAWCQALRHGFVTLIDDLALPLLAGIALAALITLAIPPDWVERWIGSGLRGMLVMMAVGMPMYICATGSVPVAAALLMKGISPGAALVFLMTGPATNAAALATLVKLLGVRAAVLYLVSVVASALIAGLALDSFGYAARIREAAACHPEQLAPWEHAAAVLLVLLLAAALGRRFMGRRKSTEG